jgi:hypothetical protein
MGVGASVALLALGAVLAWGIDLDTTSMVNVNTVGVILMIAGAIGLVVTLAIFGGRRGGTVVTEREVL